MKILIIEDNILWSERLKKTLLAFKHEPILLSSAKADLGSFPKAKVAIVNLSMDPSLLSSVIPRLKEQGTYILAHAGHKEKEKLSFGQELGCHQIVTNGTLTYKIDQILTAVK